MAHDQTSSQGDGSSDNIWAAAAPSAKKTSPPAPDKKKRSLARKLLIGGGVFIVVLVLFVLSAGLTIAGSMAPGIIESQANKAISGKVKVQDASFSWGGPQVIGPIELSGADGKDIGRVQIQSSAGVWGLLTGYLGGSIDVGQVDMTGKAAIVREAGGQTNLEKAIALRSPPAAPSGGGAEAKPSEPGVIKLGDMPAIRAKFSVKDVDISYTDAVPAGGAAGASYVVKGFTADGDVDMNSNSGIKATVQMATKVGAAASPSGSLDVQARLDVPASLGSARLTDATVNAKVNATNAPVEVLDALALQKGKLLAALGPTADVKLSIAGDMRNADATVIADTQKAKADLAFKVKDGLVTAAKPGMVTAKGETLRALVPAIDASLASQQLITLQQLPDVSVDLRSLSVMIPKDAGKIDLRGAAMDVVVKTGGVSGTVALAAPAPVAAPGPASAPATAPAKPSPFTVAPMDLHVSAADLAKSVSIALATSATVDGKPGGDVKVDLTASNILDASGAPAPAGAAVQGTVALDNIATAIAQPFVEAMKIDLPRDVGPTLNVHLTANAAPAVAGQLPVTALDADVQSQSVRVKASLELADGVLKTRGDGVTAVLATAGSMASRFVDPKTGFTLAPTGQANFKVRSLSFPLPKDGAAMDLGKLAADFEATVGGLSLAPQRSGSAAAAGPIEIRTLTTTGKLTPGGTPSITVKGDLAHDRQPFGVAVAMELKGLLAQVNGKTEISPQTLRPQGSVEFKNVPMSIVNALPKAPPAPPAPGAKPAPDMDLAALLRGAVGPTATVKVDSTPRGEALDVVASISAQNLAAEVAAGVEDRTLNLTKANVVSTIAPDTVQALVDTFAPDLTERPKLLQTTRATVQVSPIRIPLTESIFTGFKPDVANTPDATLVVALPERTLVQGLAMKNADGSRRDLGSVGVEAFQLKATFPPALLAGTSAKWSKQASATMQGRVLSGADEVLLTLAGDATATISAAGDASKPPIDKLNANVKLQQIVVGAVERLAAQERGFVSGAIGDSANISLDVSMVSPPGAKLMSDAQIDLAASLDTPRLRIPDPVKLSMLTDRLAIGSPIKLTWDIDPVWANRFLETKPAPGAAASTAAKAPARFTKPLTLRATVNRLAIARGANVGPLKAGIFGLEASADVPAVEMSAADGSVVNLNATTLNIQAKSAAAGSAGTANANAAPGDVIDVDVRIAGATVNRQGAAPVKADNMALAVTLSKLADAQGVVQPDAATVDARGDLPVIPVPLLDVFAQQDGLLTEALGPVAQATIRANQLSKKGGSLDLQAKSPRASASIQGTINGDVFSTTKPLNVTISEVSPELTKRLLKGVPLIGSVEKTPQDQPATIVGTDMKVPLGGDLSKLAGKIVVDPGEARFAAGGDFGNILKALKQKTDGQAGKHLEPLKVDIANGIATYQRWSLPLGEFQVQTEGTVDLVNKTIDVITWLPVGSLTDEAANVFKSGGTLSKLFGGKDSEQLASATMVPWRTRGTFERNKTEPDLELFAKEFVKQLKPEDLIKKGLEDLLNKKGGGK